VSDKKIRLLIKNATELKEGCEGRTFESSFKEADVGTIKACPERQFFLRHTCRFPDTSELLAEHDIEPGLCFHAIRYHYLLFSAL